MDAWLYGVVNGLAGHSGLVDDVAVQWSRFSPLILGLLVVAAWFVLPGHAPGAAPRRTAAIAIAAAIVALGVSQIIGATWFRERPFAGHEALLLVAPSTDPSFPSDHAVGAFALVTPFLLDRGSRRYGALLLLGALVLAVDRVYIGQHYPGDVAGGALLGAAAAWLLFEAAGRVDRLAPWAWWPLDLASRVTDRVIDRARIHAVIRSPQR